MTDEALARQAYAEVKTFFNQSDPLRVKLTELLQLLSANDEAIIKRVKQLLESERELQDYHAAAHADMIRIVANYHRANRTWEREGRGIPF